MRKNAKRGNELMNRYLGHLSQLYGVEEHRLVGGKGDGMRLFEIRNGRGLELTVSADRCADIARLTFKGDNMGYFAPSGYVSPAYYDREGDGFLKSFTAGFLATCGLTTVGPPDEDDGEQLPMHGTIGNCPAESIYAVTDEDAIRLHAVINPSSLFGEKLVLYREIICSLDRNCFEIVDTVRNEGDKISPLMILYHMNMGYPLLDENAELLIPSDHVKPRDARAQEGLDSWDKLLPPQEGFAEQCYYHTYDGEKGAAQIYNPTIGKGLRITFDTKELCFLTEWKQMGVRDYVLGLEPGNCNPDGRKAMRAQNKLQILAPGAEATFHVSVEMLEER